MFIKHELYFYKKVGIKAIYKYIIKYAVIM